MCPPVFHALFFRCLRFLHLVDTPRRNLTTYPWSFVSQEIGLNANHPAGLLLKHSARLADEVVKEANKRGVTVLITERMSESFAVLVGLEQILYIRTEKYGLAVRSRSRRNS